MLPGRTSGSIGVLPSSPRAPIPERNGTERASLVRPVYIFSAISFSSRIKQQELGINIITGSAVGRQHFDFKAAFDSINGGSVWKMTEADGFPPKDLGLVQANYRSAKSRVSAQDGEITLFEVNTSVR